MLCASVDESLPPLCAIWCKVNDVMCVLVDESLPLLCAIWCTATDVMCFLVDESMLPLCVIWCLELMLCASIDESLPLLCAIWCYQLILCASLLMNHYHRCVLFGASNWCYMLPCWWINAIVVCYLVLATDDMCFLVDESQPPLCAIWC